MSLYMSLYNQIEQSFFFTLSRKIFGNLSFLFAFQLITLFWLYAELTEDNQGTGLFWLMALGAIGGFVFTLFYMRFLIVRPIKAMRDTLEKINRDDGNLEAKLPQFTYDEFREVSEQYNHFTSRLSELLNTTYRSAEVAAHSNQEVAASMQQTSALGAQQISSSDSIIAASDQVTHSLQSIVGNTDLVYQANTESLHFVRGSSQSLTTLVGEIQHITQLLGNFANTVAGLKENSDNIRSILKMVEEFSDQTNLLALNAAIEAARAGEQGRGFAVVADEVRTLAQRTQESTEEIHRIIETVQSGASSAVTAMRKGRDQTNDCVRLAESAGVSIHEITDAVESIKSMNTQIAAAAEEQTAVSEDISQNITDVATLSSDTQHTIQQNSKLANDLDKMAHSLKEITAQFRV